MTVLFYDNPGCFPGAAWVLAWIFAIMGRFPGCFSGAAWIFAWIFAWIICDRHLNFAGAGLSWK